jgi:hypothetical protein
VLNFPMDEIEQSAALFVCKVVALAHGARSRKRECAGARALNTASAREHAADRPALVPSVCSHTLRAWTPARVLLVERVGLLVNGEAIVPPPMSPDPRLTCLLP